MSEKWQIDYHSIGYGAGIFATPKFTHREIVEGTIDKVDKYIQSKKDSYGHHFKPSKKSDKKMFGFDYMSNQGGVKLSKYSAPNPKIIKL